VWTPPLKSGCLPGVTRALLLDEVKIPGLRFAEKTLLPADLEAADEVFITSTTRELLPVVSIEGLSMRGLAIQADTGVRQQLQKALSAYVDSYINARKRADIKV
jgi:branched-subunit amino acid aminotransferase/4-amino-4-deoxychorismate lyase